MPARGCWPTPAWSSRKLHSGQGYRLSESDTPREAGGLMSDRRSLAGASLAAETDATCHVCQNEGGFGKLRPPLHWCSLPDDERGSGFHPIPGIGSAVHCCFGVDLTPLESF